MKPRNYDQFFTKKEIAEECIKILMKSMSIQISDFDMILEPSFGDGAFVDSLREVAGVPWDKLKFVDIDARKEEYRKDFLKSTADIVPQEYKNCYASGDSFFSKKRGSDAMTEKHCLTVGNPPFGKNASLAVAFFNQAAIFSSVIAFIVPRTFSKASVQDKLDRHFLLTKEHLLPADGYIFKGEAYSVPCVFQVWVNTKHLHLISSDGNNARIVRPPDGLRSVQPRLIETADFKFVRASDRPDFAIRRVGVNAGRIFEDSPHTCSEQSHFFIKVNAGKLVQDVLKRLKSLQLENIEVKFETAGCPSISKSELCSLYMDE